MMAVVPARGGSKEVPRKNLRPLGGVPLIVHTLECAGAAPSIDRTLVSTEDEEIAAVARSVAGVEVPFRRPTALASDTAGAIDVYLHVADWLRETEGQSPAAFCVLLPTSPLRLPDDVEGAMDLFRAREAEVVLSVQRDKPIAWHQTIRADGRLDPVDKTPAREAVANRQALSDTVVPNGSIFVLDLGALRRTRTYFGAATFGYLMPAERSVDIDEEADFRLAEALIASRGA